MAKNMTNEHRKTTVKNFFILLIC